MRARAIPRSTTPSRAASLALFAAVIGLLATSFVPVAVAVEPLPVESQLLTPRYGYGAAVIGSKGYLVGGGVEGGYSSDIVVLSPQPGNAGSISKALVEPAVAAIGNKLYIFGGAEEAGPSSLPTPQSTVFEFDPATGSSRQLLGTTLPAGASSMSAVRLGAYIYLFGGLAISTEVIDWKDWVLRFDPSNNQLRQLDVKLPSGRGQMAAVAHGDSILLLGGFAENNAAGTLCENPNAGTCFVSDILRFRPSGTGGTIGKIGDLPDRVRWAAAALYEDTVYVLGGCSSNCGAFYGFNTIVEVDAATGDATKLPVTMPTKGGRYQAVLLGDTVYVAGGAFRPQGAFEPHISDDIVRVKLGATRPWAPIALEASGQPEAGIELSWSEPGYDGSAPVLSYEVFREAGASEPIKIAEVASGTGYTDARARLGSTYTYKVRATNIAGVSSFSNEARITFTATPAAPALSAHGGNEKIVAQWTAPATSGGLPVEAYRLYAATGTTTTCEDADLWGELSGTFAVVNAVGDGPVVNGETYALRVQARNGNGWGACSAPVTATASPVPDPPSGVRATTGSGTHGPLVNVSWSRNPSTDVTEYVVYRGTTITALEELGSTGKATFTDADNVPRGVRLYYAVAARSAEGEGPLSQAASVSFASPPGPVEGLSARWTGTEVVVWWEPPLELGGGELTGYEVAVTRGAIDPTTANATIQALEEPPFEHAAPERGVPLVYHVRAVGTGGPGAWEIYQVRIPLTDDSVPPKPALSVLPSVGQVGDTLTFDASGSSDDEGVVAYLFDFGDGASTGWTSSPRVEHAYEAEGIFEATLSVRDLRGLESTEPATALIAVGPSPDVEEDPRLPTPGENGTPLPVLVTLVAVGLAAWRRRQA